MPVSDEGLFEGVQIPKQAVHTAKMTGVKTSIILQIIYHVLNMNI